MEEANPQAFVGSHGNLNRKSMQPVVRLCDQSCHPYRKLQPRDPREIDARARLSTADALAEAAIKLLSKSKDFHTIRF
jgi:hypothetical protein